jgi:hypothetical protein
VGDGGVSDTSQGHGWWLASDGKWYPPEAWTGPPPQMGPSSVPSHAPVSPYQSTPTPYPVGQNPYALGSPMPQGSGWAPARKTNGLSVASLAVSCVGVIPFFFGLPCIVGIVLGFVARSQIKRSNGTSGGSGLALAGIIVGFSLIGIFIIAAILVATFGHRHGCTGSATRFDCTAN